MKNTLYINLFGAPGSGKSTGASYIFSQLKLKGIDCEYVQEFAKDAVWENNRFLFDDPENQFVIAANQFHRLNRMFGKVDVVITDSPLEMSVLYAQNSLLDCEEYKNIIFKLSSKFTSLNYFIERVKPYNSNGRNQNEQQAKEISIKMLDFMNENNISFTRSTGDISGYDRIFKEILEKIFVIHCFKKTER